MNKRQFDQQMRKRAQGEHMSLVSDAEERFGDAMDTARMHKAEEAHGRKWKLRAVLAVECAVAIALVLFFWPRRDVTDQFPMQQEVPMVPVIQPQYAKVPEVDFVVEEGQTITLQTNVRNDTDEIWLVDWQAEKVGDSTAASQLLWMEPGTACSSRAWWQADEKMELNMSYRGYRVTAKVLHWMDGEWLKPGQEGYAEQQSLIEAAFEADALILSPGIWLNGKAGTMRLVLPDSYQKEHPDLTPLSYYVEKGMLEDAYLLCSGGESFVMEARTWAEEP